MRAAPHGDRFAVIAALVIGSALLLPLRAAGPSQAPTLLGREDAVRTVMALADDYVVESSIRNPMRAAALGLPNPRHSELPDQSLAALRLWHQTEDRWLAELVKVDPAVLVGTPAWLVYGVLRERL